MNERIRHLLAAVAMAFAAPLLLPLAVIWLFDLALASLQVATTVALARHGDGHAWLPALGAAMAVASLAMREVDIMRSGLTYVVVIGGTMALEVAYGAAVGIARLAGHPGSIDPMVAGIGYPLAMSALFLAVTVAVRFGKRTSTA